MTETEQTVSTTRFGKRQVLFDSALVPQPDEALFTPSAENLIDTSGDDLGRARVTMHRYSGLELVNRHYYRGGMMSWLGDVYFGVHAENSRSFREWCMLNIMRKQGLPVPVPVAASVISSGMFYSADLVTQRLPDCSTLAQLCESGEMNSVAWSKIGSVIGRFHESNVYHADLNARNIMLNSNLDVYLIDFDKSCFRQTGQGWRQSNLARLKRSLDKFVSKSPSFNFTDDSWRALLDGYGQS